MLLQIARIPRSTYYYHLQHLSDPQKHVRERVEIRQICEEHKGRYGYRRVTLVLRQGGYRTNHKLVMKLMREEHLSCLLRPKKYRSHRGEIGKVAPNRLNCHFQGHEAQLEMDHRHHRIQGEGAEALFVPHP